MVGFMRIVSDLHGWLMDEFRQTRYSRACEEAVELKDCFRTSMYPRNGKVTTVVV